MNKEYTREELELISELALSIAQLASSGTSIKEIADGYKNNLETGGITTPAYCLLRVDEVIAEFIDVLMCSMHTPADVEQFAEHFELDPIGYAANRRPQQTLFDMELIE